MKQKRVLIVDDEVRVAFFLKEGLEDLGREYEIATTGSAELALEQIRSHPVDLAVIDYRLPGINGLDLIRQLRELTPRTQTILITAYGSPDLEDAAVQLRTTHYLDKPFRIDELICAVQSALA
jgi:CheY-like chemotaxis protein